MFQIIEPPPTLETIVVTASIKPSKKDNLNQKIELLDRQEALSSSISGGIGEALDNNLGVRSSFFGPNASRPIIRGLGEDRIRVLTNSVQGADASTISPDHAVAIDGLEAQSIEVLKGAAALRFGANALGGVINIIDGRLLETLPNEKVTGDMFIGGTGVNKGRANSGKIKFKIDNFVFGLDAFSKKSGDYRIPGYAQTDEMRAITGDETFGKVHNSGGYNKVIGLSVNYIRPDFHFGISHRDENSNYGIVGEDAYIELEQSRYDYVLGVKLPWVFDDLSLHGSNGDYSHGEFEDTGAIGTLFNVNGYEMRLEARHKPTNGFEGVFGIQNSSRDFEAIGDEAFILPVKAKNTGYFFSEYFEKDNWGLEFGARNEKTDYSGQAGNREIDSLSYSLGGFLKPIKGLKIGATYGATERIPTETELFANGPHAATQSFEIGNPNLKTEIAKSFEVSTKFRDSAWDLELNIWNANIENFISFENSGEIDDEGLPIYQAAQKDASLKGFEAQVSKIIANFEDFDVKADFGIDYVRGKFKSGANISRMPPMGVKLGLDFKGNQSDLRIEYQYFNRQDKIGAFETKTKAANVLNLSLNYNLPQIEGAFINLAVENATNAEIREHTSVLKDFLPKPGRNIVIGLGWKF